jgi:hypothetical protein
MMHRCDLQNGLASVCCIADATNLGSGPTFEAFEGQERCCITGEACGTKGLANVCCIGDATHYRTSKEGQDCCINAMVAYRTGRLVTVATVMQQTACQSVPEKGT